MGGEFVRLIVAGLLVENPSMIIIYILSET
jgi:hypothetical protein